MGTIPGLYVTGVEKLDKEPRVWRAINDRKRCDVTGCSLGGLFHVTSDSF
jgi:hypothetical protein